jgi:2-polyprenyl-3-methyl-5-hydroxy-6-metoxy-1,4-benzoquinol methylase
MASPDPTQSTPPSPTAQSHFYDWTWTQWNDMIHYSPAPFHRRRLILQLAAARPFETVLDIGCGNGELLQALHPLRPAAHLAGVDISPQVIEANRKCWPSDEFYTLDIAAAHLPATFDLVICAEVLEHIADYPQALRNMRSMCRGYLILTTPSGTLFPIDQAMGHYRHFSPAAARALLRQSGFEPEVVWNWGFPFHTLYKYAININPGAMQARFASQRSYSSRDRLLSQIIGGLFYVNFKNSRWGQQLIVCARAVSAGNAYN